MTAVDPAVYATSIARLATPSQCGTCRAASIDGAVCDLRAVSPRQNDVEITASHATRAGAMRALFPAERLRLVVLSRPALVTRWSRTRTDQRSPTRTARPLRGR